MSSARIRSLQVGLLPFIFASAVFAQNAATSVSVDANVSRNPISPNIYGFAFGATSDLTAMNFTMNRSGGNETSTYNWQINAANHDDDYYFESILDPPGTPGYDGDNFITLTRAANVGAQPLLTIPMIGYIATLGPGNAMLWSYSIKKYGAQTASDPYQPDAGNGISAATGKPITTNKPLDANTPNSVSIQQGWVQHLIGTWGSAANGGLQYYLMDNEPSLWSSTHQDIHPAEETYNELLDDYTTYAAAVRALDPNAIIVGPEEWSWWAMFVSGHDQQNGTGAGSDYSTHNQTYYYPWLLQQLYSYQQSTGKQLLNVLSVHYYPQELSDSDDDSLSGQLTRNQSTRVLWDPTYVDPSWFNEVGINGGIVNLIPTLRGFVNQYYPGLHTAITEYNWGDEANLNGATTQADVLGIFGREGLDIATRWTVPLNPSPTYLAMEIYRNYDGNRSTFGDTSVSATVANPDYLSSFAALRSSDGALTVMVINKQQGSTPVSVSLANFATTGTAEAWQIASATQTSITPLGSVAVTNNTITATVPSQSITLLVIPAGSVTSAPGAPAGLAAMVGSGTVTLTWNQSGGATSYMVKRGTISGGPYTTLGSVADTSPTYTDTGLTNGTTYYYVVSATNAAGTSPNSAELAATPIVPPTFTSSASASPNPVNQGASTTIQATVTCASGSLTNGNIQVFVLDPNGNTAATQNYTSQNFTASQSHNYSFALTPTIAGTYTVEVGAFSATWQQWNWNSSAASITVNSNVAFTSSATAPSTLAPGGTASISVTVTETGAGGLSNANVELQIFNSAGTAVATQVWSGQNFTSGQTLPYSYNWTTAGTLATGSYSVDLGVFDSGWTHDYYWNTDATISVTTAPAPAVLSIAKSHSGSFTQGQISATYMVKVSNASGAGPTSGTVTVTETVPAGLTLVSMAGTGWACSGTGCSRSDVLVAGGSYQAITVTVNVANSATSPQVNSVGVTGGGSATASATDSTVIAPLLEAITIQTSPSGLQFSVDGGTAQTAPQTLNLTTGPHTIGVVTPQSGPLGTQYVFTGWSDSGAASHSITVGAAAATYTATFKTQYQLTMAVSPAAGGTVTPASGGFYDAATVTPISATANSGYVFSSWSGAVANANNASTTVTMSSALTVTANLSSLTGITIQTTPTGLQFTVDGGTSQTAPQTLNLTTGPHTIAVVSPQSGPAGTQYVFTGWSDTGAASHSVTVGAAAATYTATFKTQYQLTMAVSPAAGGTVTPASGGFYDAGTATPIGATANSGYVFSSWSGAVANANTASTTVTMISALTVTANFSSLTGITIQTSPIGLQFSVDGGTSQTAPQTMNLTTGPHTIAVVTPQSGPAGTQYVFTGWSDTGAASHSITVGAAAAGYTATFKTQYQLTMAASPAAGGTVTPASGGFYDAATVTPIGATANSGYVFSSWSGTVANANNASTTVTMSGPLTVTANFSPLAVASPATFAFGFQGCGNPSNQTLTVANSNTTAAVQNAFVSTGVTANSFGNWLSVSGAATAAGGLTIAASGSTQVTLSVAAGALTGPSALPLGTYSGMVTLACTNCAINGSGGGTSIPVTLTITGQQHMTTAPVTLAPFTFQQGAPTPAVQNLAVSLGCGTGNVIVTPSSCNTVGAPGAACTGGTWLQVNGVAAATASQPISTAAAQFTIGIDPAQLNALPPGNTPYQGTVTVSSPNGASAPVTLSVAAVVTAQPVLTTSTSGTGFSFTQGGGDPTSQTLQVSTISGSAGFTLTPSSAGNWLWIGGAPAALSNTASTAPITYTISVNPTALAALAATVPAGASQNFAGSIAIATTTPPAGAIAPASSVTYSLTISTQPIITITVCTANGFTYTLTQASTTPAKIACTVSNSSNAVGIGSLAIAGLPAWLNASLGATALAAGGSTTLTLTPTNLANLNPGTLGPATITISGTAAGGGNATPGTLSNIAITTAPLITLNPATPLTFGPYTQANPTLPGGQAIAAALAEGTATGTLTGAVSATSFAAGSCTGGLSTGPANWVAVSQSGSGNAATVTVAVNPGAFPALTAVTTCTGAVLVSSSGVTPAAAQVSIPVSLTLIPQTCPTLTLSGGDTAALPSTGTATAPGGVLPEISLTVGISPGAGAGCAGSFTATSSASWLTVTAGTNSFTYTALSNALSTPRSATVTLANAGAGSLPGGSLTLTVTEAGDPEPLQNRQVRALYQTVLGRDPDAGGFAFWTGGGATSGPAALGQMLDSFLTSPEVFNSDFAVMAAYQAATGAPPDYAGFTASVAEIRAGTQTIGGLFGALAAGNSGYSAAALYQNLLNRAATPDEVASANQNGLATAFQNLIGFPSNTTPIGSPDNEFQSTGSSPTVDHTNALYIQMLYYVILGRDPDPGGLTYWTGIANTGGAGILFQGQAGYATRIQILGTGVAGQGFAGSPEFQDLYQ